MPGTGNKKKKKSRAGLWIGLSALGILGLSKLGKGSKGKYSYDKQTGAISKYFNISDVTKSATASSLNYAPQFNPPDNIWENAAMLAQRFLDDLKESLPGELTVLSWYRSPFINEKIGGVPNSWHLEALAVDLVYKEGGKIKNNTLTGAINFLLNGNWNELILENGNEYNPNVVHIAYVPADQKGEILVKKDSGQYLPRTKDWLNQNFFA